MNKISKIIVLIAVSVNAYAVPITYKCINIKNNGLLHVDIDHNSLSFRSQKKVITFDYESTGTLKDKTLVHFFSRAEYRFNVHQLASNPMEIYIDNFRNKQLQAEFKCKYIGWEKKDINKTPITFKSAPDFANKFLNKIKSGS